MFGLKGNISEELTDISFGLKCKPQTSLNSLVYETAVWLCYEPGGEKFLEMKINLYFTSFSVRATRVFKPSLDHVPFTFYSTNVWLPNYF